MAGRLSNLGRVKRAIARAEKALLGVPVGDGLDPRWQAIIKVANYIETNPEEVWQFILKWGKHPNEDLRMAIATCLLEHLLENHFDEYSPLIGKAARKSKRFAHTVQWTNEFGQTKEPENQRAFRALKAELRDL